VADSWNLPEPKVYPPRTFRRRRKCGQMRSSDCRGLWARFILPLLHRDIGILRTPSTSVPALSPTHATISPMRPLLICLSLLLTPAAQARVLQLRVLHRETLQSGKSFGLAGPYELLTGKVEFALDPGATRNANIVDLKLATRNSAGLVPFTADFQLIKPVDPRRANGRILYEVGNRGGKSLLRVFQKAKPGPTEVGDGALMTQGFSLLWMGWQWDVPEGMMRMDIPVATDHGAPISGLVRGNFVLNTRSATASLADRNHKAYAAVDSSSAADIMTVRDLPLDPPQTIPRAKWHFVNETTVSLEGGFEPGRIYDVVYRARDPRVVGCGMAGTRDLIAFLKSNSPANPLPGTRFAYGWGISQSGRFIRHFLYDGFNESEDGTMVFDGMIDEVGGAGRGSFNHRFGQASRDAEQHLNIFYPVDMFPFTDAPETDPETGESGSLLATAEARHVAPKIFHILSNSEYFNRAGSLIHTDPAGTRDIEPPPNSRIYFISSGPHYSGTIPPVFSRNDDLLGQAPLNPLDRSPIVRALFQAMDRWVVDGELPPPSRFPHISDGTLTAPAAAGWPTIPGLPLPPPILLTYRLDFGPDWSRGIVSFEPPHVGKPFTGLIPAVDADGNSRAGIRLPDVEVPLATYAGWNYRAPSIGLPGQLAGEAGSFYPFPKTRAEREAKSDSRLSIAERYQSRDHYLGKFMQAAGQLVKERLLLPSDVPPAIDRAILFYDWFTAVP